MHLHGEHPCQMHIVERKRKRNKSKRDIQNDDVVQMITNLVEGKKSRGKLEGNQVVHLWGWTISFTKS
jgi:hypothetical protein